MHICMNVCICTYMYIPDMYICMYIHILHTSINTYVYYIYVYMYVGRHACAHIYVHNTHDRHAYINVHLGIYIGRLK